MVPEDVRVALAGDGPGFDDADVSTRLRRREPSLGFSPKHLPGLAVDGSPFISPDGSGNGKPPIVGTSTRQVTAANAFLMMLWRPHTHNAGCSCDTRWG